jgi:aminopeptidase YwaD
MRLCLVAPVVFGLTSAGVHAADPPLLPPSTAQALAAELSGESARRTVDALARHHRMRGSRGFHAAAEHVVSELRAAGLEDARIERFASDGRIFYGTQRSRRPWDADFAELWEVDGQGGRRQRIGSWEAHPLVLAQDSESGEATAELIDVGLGTSESDYTGKNVKGRLVLVSAQPSAVAALAVGTHGAAGIVSFAQNQRTAWWGEDQSLVRWGHLDTFATHPTFAFMVSPAQARAWRDRLARGESVRRQGGGGPA